MKQQRDGMTDTETIAHLRQWVCNPPGSPFGWPTDACGYEQHIRFVTYRNKALRESSPENLKAWYSVNDYAHFVLGYADKLEHGEIPPYTTRMEI